MLLTPPRVAHGTWTPVLKGLSTAGTYQLQLNSSRWTRVGDLVFLHIYVATAAVITGGGTGSLAFNGLPYSKIANHLPIGSCQLSGIAFSGSLSLCFDTSAATSNLCVFQSDTAGGTWNALAVSAVGASDSIAGTIVYETNDRF